MNQRLSQKRADPVEELRPEVTLARRIVELLGNPSAILLQVLRDGSVRVIREDNVTGGSKGE